MQLGYGWYVYNYRPSRRLLAGGERGFCQRRAKSTVLLMSATAASSAPLVHETVSHHALPNLHASDSLYRRAARTQPSEHAGCFSGLSFFEEARGPRLSGAGGSRTRPCTGALSQRLRQIRPAADPVRPG